jgi:DNA polymerase/3'-5' exonuclease PolX
MNNFEVAQVLTTLADTLEIQGEDLTKSGDRRAAENITSLTRDVNDLRREVNCARSVWTSDCRQARLSPDDWQF